MGRRGSAPGGHRGRPQRHWRPCTPGRSNGPGKTMQQTQLAPRFESPPSCAQAANACGAALHRISRVCLDPSERRHARDRHRWVRKRADHPSCECAAPTLWTHHPVLSSAKQADWVTPRRSKQRQPLRSSSATCADCGPRTSGHQLRAHPDVADNGSLNSLTTRDREEVAAWNNSNPQLTQLDAIVIVGRSCQLPHCG